jgi:PleD family two-component response regulator
MAMKGVAASGLQMDKQKSNASHFATAVILVVDDDLLQRDILKVILSDEGYQTLEIDRHLDC